MIRPGNSQTSIDTHAARRLYAIVVLMLASFETAGGEAAATGERAETASLCRGQVRRGPRDGVLSGGLNVLANHGPVTQNKHADLPLILQGQVFERGFYCHAPSRIAIRLPGPGKSFSARVGINSNYMTRPGRGSIICSVHVAGREAYRSDVLRRDAGGPRLRSIWAVPKISCCRSKTRGTAFPATRRRGSSTASRLRTGARCGSVICRCDGPTAVRTRRSLLFVRLRRPAVGRSPARLDRPARKPPARRRADRARRGVPRPQSGLSLRCVGIEYRDFRRSSGRSISRTPAEAETPISSSNLQALELLHQRTSASEYRAAPTKRRRLLADELPAARDAACRPNSKHRFAPAGGRPTNGAFPYFNIEWPGEGAHRRGRLARPVGRRRSRATTERRSAGAGGPGADPLQAAARRGGAHAAGRAAVLEGRPDPRAERLAPLDARPQRARGPGGKPPPPPAVRLQRRLLPGDGQVQRGERDAVHRPLPRGAIDARLLVDGRRLVPLRRRLAQGRHLGGRSRAVPPRPAGDQRPRARQGHEADRLVRAGAGRAGTWLAENHPEWILGGAERRPAGPRQSRRPATWLDRPRRRTDHRAGHRPLPPGLQHGPARLLAGERRARTARASPRSATSRATWPTGTSCSAGTPTC